MTFNDNKEDLRQKSHHLPQMLMKKVHYLWCLEEMRNPNQMQQPIEESLWLAHTTRLSTCIIDNKKTSIEGTKENRWRCVIVVYAQVW
jgi:hypothetical protein